ncbi:hypothetical protein GCM10010404_54490 [Nonomuraea africana]|uniref:F5/8 type C domain-containing protein n=1 Tax=Nonomuraea africana TaxID=46171 RepID=A0ABR9K5U0_9ACTN|nr:discoidin domain-containing protein [Nonomuraea africana]MBE1557376.1 hypothetical protein [Nonomuraea africana]
MLVLDIAFAGSFTTSTEYTPATGERGLLVRITGLEAIHPCRGLLLADPAHGVRLPVVPEERGVAVRAVFLPEAGTAEGELLLVREHGGEAAAEGIAVDGAEIVISGLRGTLRRVTVTAFDGPYRPEPNAPGRTGHSDGHSGGNALTDGDPASPWASAAGGVTFPGEFVVDYGNARQIATVTLHTAWAKGQGITDVSLETWDGSAWVPQVAHHLIDWRESSAKVETSTVTLPKPVTTQKLRLTVHKANLQWGNLALYEIATTAP